MHPISPKAHALKVRRVASISPLKLNMHLKISGPSNDNFPKSETGCDGSTRYRQRTPFALRTICLLPNCNTSSNLPNLSPLPIRISIRDSFDPPTVPVQLSLSRLSSIVGYDFSLSIPWVDIHRDLASSFPDISVLVPSVATALTSYLDRLITLLDNEKFQDAFLEKTSVPFNRDIIVRVGEQTNEDKSCFEKNGRLMVSLPQTGPDWYRRMSSRVGHDLEALFLTGGVQATTSPTGVSANPKPAIADWVDIPSSSSVSRNIPMVTSLPSVNTLSKPETLFSSLLPYYVIVTNSGANIHVQASHQPTIDLVHNYFRMHTRKNMNHTSQVPLISLVDNYFRNRTLMSS